MDEKKIWIEDRMNAYPIAQITEAKPVGAADQDLDTKPLHILYLLEPQLEMNDAFFRYGSLKSIIVHEARKLEGLKYSDVEERHVRVSIIASSDVLAKAISDQVDLGNIRLFPYKGRRDDPKKIDEFLRTVAIKLKPDIVIAYENYRQDLPDIFPESKIIHMSFGPFSRFPFPTFHLYDTRGLYQNSSILDEADLIDQQQVGESEKNFIADFRNKSLSILAEFTPYKSFIHDLRAKHKNIVLFAAQVDGHPAFTSCSTYASHIQALEGILADTPHETCILVTEHPYRPTFNDEQKKYLVLNFPHVAFLPPDMIVGDASQFLIPYSDGLITTSSNLGYQSALFGLPLFVIGRSQLSILSHHCEIKGFLDAVINGTSVDAAKRNIAILIHILKYRARLFRHAISAPEEYLHFLINLNSSNEGAVLDYNLGTTCTTDTHSLDFITNSVNRHAVELQSLDWNLPKNISKGDMLLKAIADHEVISFDLFDTLVQRPLSKPHLLFRLIEPTAKKIVGNPKYDFWLIRREAEADVRRPTKGNIEVTIDQIYDRIHEISGLDPDVCQQLCDLEKRAELQICQRKESVLFYLFLARRLGKKTGVVSDFYIEEAFVQELLLKREIPHDFLFVSATEGLRKHNGTIYPTLIEWAESRNYQRNSIVHVGDNKVADLKMANANEIEAFWMPQAIENFGASVLGSQALRNAHLSDSISDSVITGLLAAKYFSGPFHHRQSDRHIPTHHQALGYATYGPLLLGFTKWLYRKCKENGYTRVNFLSRDGHILKKAFDYLYGDEFETQYLYASRKAYTMAAAKKFEDLRIIASFSFSSQKFEDFVNNRFNIDLMVEKHGLRYPRGLVPTTIVSYPQSLGLILNWIELNEEYLLKRCSVERECLLEYFKSPGLGQSASDPCVIVDLGYSGTMQAMMEELLPGQVQGMYMLSHTLSESWLSTSNISAYLTEHDDHFSRFRDEFNDHVFIFEAASSAPHASVVSFVGLGGKFEVQFGEAGVEGNNSRFLSGVQEGMLEFVSDAQEFLGEFLENVHIAPNLARAALVSLAKDPKKPDASLFIANGVENNFGGGSVYLIYPIPNPTALSHRTRDVIVARSKWKRGAEIYYADEGQVKSLVDIQGADQKLVTSIRHRKLGKLQRDPYLFFADSKIKWIAYLRHFFGLGFWGRMNSRLLKSALKFVRT